MSRVGSQSTLLLLLAMAALCSGAAGCAIKTAHLPILQWPIERRALYFSEPAPYRVVVLPVVDQRPDLERNGQKPGGMFLLLWNRRVGDYYTGDLVFGGDVATRLSQQLAAYLRAANVFTEVEYASASYDAITLQQPFLLQQLANNHQADYLLSGELQHFFGSQHQQFSMYVLPLYFINTYGWQNGKGLPWGQTTLRVSLIDGRSGDILWRHPVEASHTLPRETDSMAQAALESFTLLADRLATELRQLPFESMNPRVALDQP